MTGVITLFPKEFRAFFAQADGVRQVHGVYRDQQEIRALVADGLLALVEEHSRDWFAYLCGRCGNSCRRPGVLVREQEILPLQLRLGVSEFEFRERFLDAAWTWNPGDGALRLQGAACPFLENNQCTVYEVRPQACRDFRSDAAMCLKSGGPLIEQLVVVEVGPQYTRTVLKSGTVCEGATPKSWYEQLLSLIRVSEPPPPDRYRRLADQALEVVRGLLDAYHPDLVDDAYRTLLGKVRGMVESLTRGAHLDAGVTQAAESAWAAFLRLEEMLEQGTTDSAAPPPVTSPDNPHFVELILEESSLRLRLRDGTQRRLGLTDPILRQAAAAVLQQILQRPEDTVQMAIQEAEPECYLCGECCRFYQVEIQPSDILRLCRLLAMQPSEFVRLYTDEPLFGWNPKARILRKELRPRSNRILRELPVVGHSTALECVFMERRHDGFHYCSVHSHKPDVCRVYQPTHPFCRLTNQRLNWGRQAHSLRWVRADARHIEFGTPRVARYVAERRDWPDVHRALMHLEQLLLVL